MLFQYQAPRSIRELVTICVLASYAGPMRCPELMVLCGVRYWSTLQCYAACSTERERMMLWGELY
eukprot:45564-Rhodomonas_salina.4